MSHLVKAIASIHACCALWVTVAAAQDAAQGPVSPERPRAVAQAGPVVPTPADPVSAAKEDGPAPFGANLFMGNFLRAREDGLNPDYVVMPGDRVAVHTWGAFQLSDVFVVDAQGNLFLPQIGPVPLAGVKNSELTQAVSRHIKRVYIRHVEVYTNLLTAKPVAVFVTGGVARPGRYPGVPSDSVLFFLDQAGGIDPRLGSYRRIQVLREGQPLADLDLYDFMLRGTLSSPQLRDGDTILVHRRGPVVELRGDVARKALVELGADGALGADALSVVPKAAAANEVTLEGVRNGMPIRRTLSAARFERERVFDGDVITLRDEGRSETILVRLDGEHEGDSILSVRRGSRLIDVLNHVPVRPELSNTAAVHLRRPSVARAQKDSINDSLFRLERSALLALSDSRGEAEIRVKEAELMQRFAERARAIDPLGRVVTSSAGRQVNVLLEDGDTIVIPAKTQVVRIGGEVHMAHAVAHRPGLTAAEYISLAGGYTDRADEGLVVLLHPNAEVEMVDPDAVVAPGDEILVPPDVDTKIMQGILDVSQIIYQIAVAAAVVPTLAGTR